MQSQTYKTPHSITFVLLVSRLLLFLLFQALIALLANSWNESEKYWLLSATLTNIVSITLLYILFKRDGKKYVEIFSIDKASYKKDIMIFIGLTLISLPIVFLPGYFLSMLLWGNANVPTELMFGPIEKWLVYILLIAFPLTIALAELATYFMYIMPKLKNQLKVKWLAVALPVLFLSLQHCTLPFIPDIDFIIYRALVFLPFSILIGVSIYHRHSLFVYFAVLHGILDFGTVLMFII